VDKIDSSFERHLYGVYGIFSRQAAGMYLDTGIPLRRDVVEKLQRSGRWHSFHSFVLNTYHYLLSLGAACDMPRNAKDGRAVSQ
jgi:hypothetical protein